jgi:hypothetical protein
LHPIYSATSESLQVFKECSLSPENDYGGPASPAKIRPYESVKSNSRAKLVGKGSKMKRWLLIPGHGPVKCAIKAFYKKIWNS